MNRPEGAAPPGRSLLDDWLAALRYWLRGRNGVIAALALAVVVGGALNWSWLVAAGIAPLLITALPCVAMCALGLCMNRMSGRACATEARPVETPEAAAPTALSADAGAPVERPLLTGAATPLAATPPDERAPGVATPAGDAAPARPVNTEARN